MAHTGYIPELLDFVVKPETQHVVCADGKDYVFNLRPAFAYPSGHERFAEAAEGWGKEYGRIDPKDLLRATMDNRPFTDLRWVGIDHRSQGGVAYQVATEKGWLFDLREDVFIECMMAGEIERRGGMTLLTGKFIWAVAGSQVRMIRKGSVYHQELMVSGRRSKMAKIPNKDLVPGTIYAMKSQKRVAFLGRIRGEGMVMLDLERGCFGRAAPQDILDGQVGHVGHPKYMPFFYITKSTSFVEAVGTVNVPDDLMDRYAAHLKARRAQVERERREYEKQREVERARLERRMVKAARR